MRVLQLISPTGFYGAERWILALARHLGELDVSCDLAVTSEQPDFRFELIERFPTDNGKTHRVELSGRFDLRSVSAIRSIIAERGIDLVHSHGYKSDILAWLVTRNSSVPCISTPHGYGHGTNQKLKWLVRIGSLALRAHNKVVPLSQQLFDETVAFGVPKQKVVLIGNGVDLVEIDAAVQRLKIQTSKPGQRIGYVGQLIPRKRVHEMIEVFNTLWQTDNTRTLEIAGDGSERPRLQALAQTLPCAEAIHFHGFVEERLKLMHELDLFVMTSEEEGIPRCMMEAQGIGVPVAAYNIDGVNELIIDEETGLLAPLGDQAKLASQCERLLVDRSATAQMADNGYQRIRNHFSFGLKRGRNDALCQRFQANGFN